MLDNTENSEVLTQTPPYVKAASELGLHYFLWRLKVSLNDVFGEHVSETLLNLVVMFIAVDEMIAEVDIDGDGRIDYDGETKLYAHVYFLGVEIVSQ